MKVLILSMTFPYPLKSGGKIRVYNLIRHLSRECRITLLSLATREEAHSISELEKFCERVETVPLAEMGLSGLARHVRTLIAMASGLPAEMARKRDPAFSRALHRILSRESFDLIQVEFSQMLPYLLENGIVDRVPAAIWVEHEVLHRRLGRRAESSEGFRRTFWRREERLTREYEIPAARKFRNVIAVSEEEASAFRSWNPGLEVAVIPNGVDVAHYDAVEEKREPESMIFVGWMRHFPNEDGAHFLLHEVIPRIVRKRPGARLYLVGDYVPNSIRQMASKIPQVILTGYVEDVRPFVKRASVAIVPLRVGGGTHLKVLEAMAARTPVVTTPVGAEGLPLKDGVHAWIAGDAQGLADGVLRLMGDEPLRGALTSEARRLVEREYDWKTIADKQMAFYRRILNRGFRQG